MSLPLPAYRLWRSVAAALPTVAACLCMFAILAAVFFPLFVRAREYSGPSCSSLHKGLASGIMMYLQDYDERYPPAAHWLSSIESDNRANPYFSNNPYAIRPGETGKSYLRCPCFLKKKHPLAPAYNARMSGVTVQDITDPKATVMIFETERDGINIAGGPALLTVPGRHRAGALFSYADGHVEMHRDGDRQKFGLR
jgi:prepilin-type processing-associated H-X9-DG protein